jgi:hypothetical protein
MPDGSVRMGSLHTFLKADGNNRQQGEKPSDQANEKQSNDDKNKQEKSEKPPSPGKQQPAAQKPNLVLLVPTHSHIDRFDGGPTFGIRRLGEAIKFVDLFCAIA